MRAGASARSSAGRNGALGTNEGGRRERERDGEKGTSCRDDGKPANQERERERGRYFNFFTSEFWLKNEKKGK